MNDARLDHLMLLAQEKVMVRAYRLPTMHPANQRTLITMKMVTMPSRDSCMIVYFAYGSSIPQVSFIDIEAGDELSYMREQIADVFGLDFLDAGFHGYSGEAAFSTMCPIEELWIDNRQLVHLAALPFGNADGLVKSWGWYPMSDWDPSESDPLLFQALAQVQMYLCTCQRETRIVGQSQMASLSGDIRLIHLEVLADRLDGLMSEINQKNTPLIFRKIETVYK